VADPASIVLTDVEVVIVAKLEACMAELPVAAVLWLLSQSQVPLQVNVRVLLAVDLQQFWDKCLKAFVLKVDVFLFGRLGFI